MSVSSIFIHHGFLSCLVACAICLIVVNVKNYDKQWNTMLVYGIFLIAIAPPLNTPIAFFRGYFRDTTSDNKSCCLLGSSAFIAWVFAKSIYNSSTLGAKFGLMGGFAYACYYSTFGCVGLTAYRLRTKYGYRSLAEAINDNYGQGATLAYLLAILFRLYQEIWSNSSVIAGFYGEPDSSAWWWAACVSTLIPLLYTLTGGLRSALVSDAVQAVLVVGLFIALLSVLDTKAQDFDCTGFKNCTLLGWNPNPSVKPWSLEGGLDLAIVGVLQGGLSYGFFDPILVDRAFLAKPSLMLKSFFGGGAVAAVFILFFSLMGVYGNMYAQTELTPDDPDYEGNLKGIPASVARAIGTAFFTIVNIVFLTSSMSTIDSTFSSTAKFAGFELTGFFTKGRPLVPQEAKQRDVVVGRISMVLMAIVGTLPLLQNPRILNATTVSGTLVMGLGPPILFCGIFKGYRPLAFHIPFWIGVALGTVYQLSTSNKSLNIDLSGLEIGNGHYATLLGINVLGVCLCFGTYFVFIFENHKGRDFDGDTRRWTTKLEDEVDAKGENMDTVYATEKGGDSNVPSVYA